ncbi:MAG: BrnT family toxin [Deltaproteobacteria bacterium]|nr:BrnT family toxin [Deltaproteobacteria bacterium]
MKIDYIICPDNIENKLESRHNVTVREARQTLLYRPRIRFAEKGYTEGDNVYAAFGQTFSGRYLAVFFVYKPKTKTAIIISARDMSEKERKAYGRR